jgi:membrane-bound ClpP family serine protease
MRPTTILLITAAFSFLAAIVVIALWRHKKAARGELKLIGEIATVETTLAPEGTVIVSGELWPARSCDGSLISAHARVRIVGLENVRLLVKPCA